MDGVDTRLRNFARSASGLASFIVSPIAAATESLVALTRVVVDSGRYAVNTAMQYEQLGIQLEVIARDADKGKQMLEDMFQVAINTPFQVKEVAAAGKELAAFGFSVEQIVPLVKQLGDVSAGTGTPMHRLILAFGQAKIAGRLMGQEMRQFVNANVPMIEHLAAVLGKPTLQIKKMIENGQVGFDIVQQAMNRMTGEGGIFGGMMERMNKTAIGQWRSFIESLEIGLYKVGKVFFEVFDLQDTFRSWKEWAMDTSQDAGGLKVMFEGIRDILHSIRDVGRIVWESIRRVLGAVGDVVDSISAWVSLYKETFKIIAMILVVTTTLRLVTWGVAAAWAAIRAIVIAVNALLAVNAIISAASGIGALLAGIAALSTPLLVVLSVITLIVSFTDLLSNLGDNLLHGFDSIANDFSKAWKAIKQAVDAGDLTRAFDIAFKAIEIGWRTLLLSLQAEFLAFGFRLAMDAKSTGLNLLVRGGLAAEDLQSWTLGVFGINQKGADWSILDREKKRQEDEIQRQMKMFTQEFISRDPRLLKLQSELDTMTKGGGLDYSSLSPEMRRLVDITAEGEGRTQKAGHPLGYFQNEIETMNSLTSDTVKAIERQYKAYQEMKRFSKYGMFDPDFVAAATRVSSIQNTIDKLKSDRQSIIERPIRNALEVVQFARSIVGQIGGIPGGFNTSAVQYSLSGEAKSLAEKVQQQYMRGVGEETHKYDYFMKNMGLIDQARTGMTPDYKAAFDVAGPISKMFLQAGASKNVALSADEADYGLLNEFDKIKKYVGDRMAVGPRAMAFGSSEAQDTINRAVTQQVPVLDQIRTVMEAAKDMQRQQLEYQKQAVDALRELSGSKPPAAPMPREAGFAVDKP